MVCRHKRSFYFHENAPAYCPDCDCYLDGNTILKKSDKYKLIERKQKIDKILKKTSKRLFFS